MKRFFSKFLQLFLVGLLFSACTPTPIATQPLPASPLPAISTPTSTQVSTSTATALPSPTLTPEAITFLPTSRQQPGAWNLQYPYSDPNAPQLFSASAGGYRLNPNFQVARIDLAYRWIGIGPEMHAYERIERRSEGYWRDTTQISPDAIGGLIQSIANLHREAYMLNSTCASDDYPFWAIEMTDVNSNTVLLFSDSNGENFAPWNVAYNGEIYAQFDGQIPVALAGLFSTVQERMQDSFCEPIRDRNYLPVIPSGEARSLTVGYTGLIPLYWDIFYRPDVQKGELRGNINGFGWSSQVDGKSIHWLSDLKSMQVISPEGEVIPCPIVTTTQDDEKGVIYNHVFTCPVGTPREEPTYSYPIHIQYTNPENQSYTLSGTLDGYWESPKNSLPSIPYPDEIAKILESAPQSADFISTHIVQIFYPYMEVDRNTGLADHHWEGDVTLLGQAQVGERILPYSLTLFKMTIEDGKLTRWDIDQAELASLLKAVLDQPITHRYLDFEANPGINLYYAKTADNPIIDDKYYSPCDGLPDPHDLPIPGQPLRGFSFNAGPSPTDMQLFFMDGRLWIDRLSMYVGTEQDAFWLSLLPPELKPKDADPFSFITYGFGGSGVGVSWDENASPEEIDRYRSLLESWNVELYDWTYDPGVTFKGVMLDLTPDGELVLVNCKAP